MKLLFRYNLLNLLTFVLLFQVGLVSLLNAEESSRTVHDRAYANIGWFYPDISTDLRLDSKTLGIGTSVSLEDDLGIKDRLSQLSVEAGFYLTKRFRISGEYFELNRSKIDSISREIQWGDDVFEVNASVKSKFDFQLYRIAFGYDLIQNEHTVLGIGIGAHLIDAVAGLEAALGATPTTQKVGTDASSSGIFPIPNIGLYYHHLFREKWKLNARIDWFGISAGEWDGQLISAGVNLNYFFTQHISLGVGAEFYRIDINYDNTDWHGALDLEFYGPLVMLGCRF